MPNVIALAQRYLPVIDEVYKKESKTALLDATGARVRFLNANTVQIFKTALNGLGDYSRNGGYVTGDVTSSWEQLQLTKDRGRAFQVDAMDDEETIGMAFGTLVGEFLRTRAVPELDAYRFATMAATAGILTATPADVVPGTTAVASAIYNAEAALGDAEVPEEGRILFISENAYHGLRADGQIQRMWQNEGDLRTEIEMFDGMRVVRVPKARFCTGITLYDGTTVGQEDGGYEFSSGTSYPINFMIVHPSAVIQVVKHALPRIFDPNTNQAANAWKFDYRLYHDLFVEANKVQGIYLHRAATALAADING